MTWPAPSVWDPTPCPFIRAWSGRCGELDRSNCRHGERCSARVLDFDKLEYVPCDKPAIEECSFAGQFVCGRPICDTCRCPEVGH